MFGWFRKKNVYALPLDATDAITDGPLLEVIPVERRYRIGPFWCDTSPVSHTGAFRYAVDFVVADGSPVLATRAGVVVDVVDHHTEHGPTADFADRLNYVTIQHDDGEYSQYAHLAAHSVSIAGVRINARVVRGQKIATTGKTGWVEYGEYGDHLHFMVFKHTDTEPGFVTIPITWQL